MVIIITFSLLIVLLLKTLVVADPGFQNRGFQNGHRSEKAGAINFKKGGFNFILPSVRYMLASQNLTKEGSVEPSEPPLDPPLKIP